MPFNERFCDVQTELEAGMDDDVRERLETERRREDEQEEEWERAEARRPLRDAAAEGNVRVVVELYPHASRDQRIDVWTTAAQAGHLDVVRWLASHGDLNDFQLSMGATTAARRGRLGVLKWLVGNVPACRLNDRVFACAVRGRRVRTAFWIRARVLWDQFRLAVRAWMVVSYWMRATGESQGRPGGAVAKAALDAFAAEMCGPGVTETA
jgi:hypothetical protein